MHPVSTAMFTCLLQLLNTTFLLYNHGRFQNIHGKETSFIKKSYDTIYSGDA